MGWFFTVLGVVAYIFFTKNANQISREWLVVWFFTTYALMLLTRVLFRKMVLELRRRGYNLRHIVIVGEPAKSAEIADKIKLEDWLGISICGYFGPAIPDGQDIKLARLGDQAELFEYLKQHRVDEVWVTLSINEINSINSISKSLEKTSVSVILMPDISSWRLLNHSYTHIKDMVFINITASPMSIETNAAVKWLEDKILCLLILILISPVMLIISIAIKIFTPGPVFYVQDRVSWNGEHFKMLKFRSMPVDADKTGGNPVWGQAVAKKPTRLGAFLRKTSLDELPQFINVLIGDMSIVGPRPERPVFVEQFRNEIDRYMLKHLVKAGITGWAQVNGWRGDSCLQTRIEYDLYYIENWSLGFDLKIILLTLFRGFVHKNAK